MNTYFLKDVDKYNKYMSISDIIYVNINSKCDVGKFDNNISTYYDKNNNKIIKSNKREAKVVKVNGKYGVKTINGVEKIPATYDDLTYTFEDYYIAKKEGKYGIVNEKNEEKLSFNYTYIKYLDTIGILQADT